MNYARARQRVESGLWDWTFRRDKITYQSEPCNDTCQHATQEDADRHFYEWCLEQVEEIQIANMQLKCRVCGTWTDKELGNRHMGMYFTPVPLCDAHRNAEGLREVLPLHSPIEIWYS